MVDGVPYLLGFSAHRGPDIVWKSDSSEFYFVVPVYDNKKNYVGQKLSRVPVQGKPEDMFTFFGLPFNESYISNDGTRVAVLVYDGTLTNLHIITSKGDLTYISDTGIGFLGWNPDSTHVVVWENDQPTNPFMEDVSYIGAPLQLLTNLPGQNINSFEWVTQNCFIYTISKMDILAYYIKEPDAANDSNVMIASNAQLGKYDFAGTCTP